MNEVFNFNEAVKELLAGKKISGKDGILAPLVKQLVEAAFVMDQKAAKGIFESATTKFQRYG